MLSPCLLVIHDTSRRGKDNVAKLTRRKQLDNPFFKISKLNVIAGVDDAALVYALGRISESLSEACWKTFVPSI